MQKRSDGTWTYYGWWIERIPHNGFYVARKDGRNRLMADTSAGIKQIIRLAEGKVSA